MIDLESLSYDELVLLNDQIVDRLNYLDTLHSMEAMASLQIGTRVSFESQKGRQTGRVVKLNMKTVRVVTDDGRNWKVPAYLVTKVVESDNTNLIKISGKKKGRR